MPKVAPEKLEARRQEILAAAVTCFARNGFHKTTMADIAAEAGVSDTLAYRYFSDKDDIIKTAMQQGVRAEASAVLSLNEGEDPADTWHRILNATFERFAMPGRREILRMRTGAWSQAWDDEDVRAEVNARWEIALELEEQFWERAKTAGLIRGDLGATAIGTVMQALHDGLDLLWAHNPQLDLEGCRRVVEALTFGSFWQGDPRDGRTRRSV